MDPVRLGIIGTGLAANRLHWPALEKMKDRFDLVQVCNHSEGKAREFSSLTGAPYVLDYKELLANPEVEAVSILLPIELNYPVTKEALEAGKHVLVEKPLALDMEEGAAMLELEKQYPEQVVMVGENFRYHPRFLKIRQLLNEGAIGSPYAFIWNEFFFVNDENPYAKTQWRLDHKYKGGFITDGGVHNIAAIRDLLGDITWASSLSGQVNPDIGEMDSFSLQFTTAGDVTGVLNLYLSANGMGVDQITILGREASLVAEKDRIIIRQGAGIREEHEVGENTSYWGEYADFYAAIREGKKPASSFAEAYRDLETLLGVL